MKHLINAKFVVSVGADKGYITDGLPQIAMVGKSNVGKSSMINTLCNNFKLARTSASPGKTRLINYFLIDSRFYLVDLPGYGFAKASKDEKGKWGELMESYLSSGTVGHVFLLLDCRHTPTADDKQMFYWINYYCVPYTLVATKLDKLPRSKRPAALAHIKKSLGAIGLPMAFSSEDRTGLDAIIGHIEQIAAPVGGAPSGPAAD